MINPMKYMSVFAKLYHMLVCVDNSVNEKELSIGKQMVTIEGFSEREFNQQLEKLKQVDTRFLFSDCVKELRTLERIQQIRCIAWMCLIANADGFMDKAEWQFIYKIYHKELQIPLTEIMKVQNELIRLTHINMISHETSRQAQS
jgi:uncharacterized tellurite resistance protein B-like protein